MNEFLAYQAAKRNELPQPQTRSQGTFSRERTMEEDY